MKIYENFENSWILLLYAILWIATLLIWHSYWVFLAARFDLDLHYIWVIVFVTCVFHYLFLLIAPSIWDLLAGFKLFTRKNYFIGLLSGVMALAVPVIGIVATVAGYFIVQSFSPIDSEKGHQIVFSGQANSIKAKLNKKTLEGFIALLEKKAQFKITASNSDHFTKGKNIHVRIEERKHWGKKIRAIGRSLDKRKPYVTLRLNLHDLVVRLPFKLEGHLVRVRANYPVRSQKKKGTFYEEYGVFDSETISLMVFPASMSDSYERFLGYKPENWFIFAIGFLSVILPLFGILKLQDKAPTFSVF